MRPRLVMFLVSLATLAVAAPAHATFPGANGKIAFGSNRDGNSEIYAVNPDGTGLTRLTSDPAKDFSPAWSADGTKVAFASDRAGGVDQIYVMNADGSGVTRLTNDAAYDNQPAWSPDGSKVVFRRQSLDLHQVEIDVINANGTGQTTLAATGDGYPAWSPDGTRIAYQGNDSFTGKEIWTMNPDGSGQTRLSNVVGFLGFPGDPNWSPDSQKIVFSNRETDGEYGCGSAINVINRDGSGQNTIVAGQNCDSELLYDPIWSPDGGRIVFGRSYISSDWFTVDPDGGNEALFATLTSADFEPDWRPLARASYERPASAPSLSTALVPVAKQCGTGGNPANRQHAPPLSVGSCPPSPSSSVVHVGPQMQGSAAATVTPGDSDPTNGDQANVTLAASLTDIETTAGGDYDPNTSGADLTWVVRLRLTDQANGYGGVSATATDFDFAVPIDCTPTSDPAVGSSCAVNTTADSLMPGFAQEGRKAVVQVFRVRIYDSGANGTRQNGTGDDKIFSHEGVFVP